MKPPYPIDQTSNSHLNLLGRIQLRHLVALCAVARERSFSRAAESLGYSQSAVSQQIRGLEKKLNVQVFDRPGGPLPVRLTPVGRMLFNHAEQILEEVRVAELELAAFTKGEFGTVNVGTYESVAVHLLPKAIRLFRIKRPEVALDIREATDQSILIHQLTEGELDIAFVHIPLVQEHTDIDVVPLYQEPWLVVSPASAPLVNTGEPIKPEGLNALPIVAHHPCLCQFQLEQTFRENGVPLHIQFRSNDNTALQALVRNGLGHALMPRLSVDTSDPGVVAAPLDDSITDRTMGMAVSARGSSSPVFEAFETAVRSACMDLAAEFGITPSETL